MRRTKQNRDKQPYINNKSPNVHKNACQAPMRRFQNSIPAPIKAQKKQGTNLVYTELYQHKAIKTNQGGPVERTAENNINTRDGLK